MLKNKILVILSLIALLLISTNCTLIGVGLGTYADATNNNEYHTIKNELFTISPGTDISIVSINGDTLEGTYHNTSNVYSLDYVAEYNNKFDEIRKELVAPKINDTLFISAPNEKNYKYIFLGFDYNSIYAKSILSNNESFIKMNPDYKFKLAGEYLNMQWIKKAIEFKTIPIMSKMNLENNTETLSIFYHQIKIINTKSSSYSAIIILSGITADLLIIKNSDFPFLPGVSLW